MTKHVVCLARFEYVFSRAKTIMMTNALTKFIACFSECHYIKCHLVKVEYVRFKL